MEAGLLSQIPAEMRNGDAMTAIHVMAAAAILMVGLACAILPFAAVWDYYCEQMGVPVREAWLSEVKQYECDVLSKRN